MYRSWGCGLPTVLVLCAACSAVENATTSDPATSLDEAVFRCRVQPILVKQCSYIACHGIAATALRLYSPGKLRADPAANIDALIAPLTDAEQHANFESAAGFAFGTQNVDDNFLLRKPLAAVDGGYEHAGGAIFASGADSQLGTIRAWLLGQGACP